MKIFVDREEQLVTVSNDYGNVVQANLSAIRNELDRVQDNLSIKPRNCIFNAKVGRNEMFVIEVPPGLHTIRSKMNLNHDHYYDDDPDDENCAFADDFSRLVAMPWQYFVFVGYDGYVDQFKLFWSKTRIKDVHGSLYRAQLPNIDEEDYVCMGSTWNDASTNIDSIDATVGGFFDSYFNGDLGSFEEVLPMNIENWEVESRTNPVCWQTFSFELRTTIYELYQEMIPQNNDGDYEEGDDIFDTIAKVVNKYGDTIGLLEAVS
jgi:hypothetical protein